MSLSKITVNGETVNLEFGYAAHAGFIQGVVKYPTKFLNEKSELTGYGCARLFLCAYENYCMNRDLDVIHTFDTFLQYVTEGNDEEKASAINAWSVSTHTKKMIADAEKKSQAQPLETTTLSPSEPSTLTTLSEPATDSSE